ncbi:hypothetical protein AgCh_013550 [Apium graveolens]
MWGKNFCSGIFLNPGSWHASLLAAGTAMSAMKHIVDGSGKILEVSDQGSTVGLMPQPQLHWFAIVLMIPHWTLFSRTGPSGDALLLACKYKEVAVPVVEDLIVISDRAYNRIEVLEMDGISVLSLLLE